MSEDDIAALNRMAGDLGKLSTEKLLFVLQQVLSTKTQVDLVEINYYRDRLFLGYAFSWLKDDAAEPLLPHTQLPDTWEPWQITAIAYPDPAQYPSPTLGEDGFYNNATCTSCGTAITTNFKSVLCPICGSSVFGT